jgi:hypothetical protein
MIFFPIILVVQYQRVSAAWKSWDGCKFGEIVEPAYETDSLKHRRKESYVRFLLHSMESAIQNQNLTYTTGYKCNFTKKRALFFYSHQIQDFQFLGECERYSALS